MESVNGRRVLLIVLLVPLGITVLKALMIQSNTLVLLDTTVHRGQYCQLPVLKEHTETKSEEFH